MVADCEKKNTSSYPIASLVKRVLHLFRETLDEALRPYGITAAQIHVLAVLDREPGISGAKLARRCLVTPQTTQVLLRTIESNGWIVRAVHPENKRILLASLTPSGKRMLTRSPHRHRAYLQSDAARICGNRGEPAGGASIPLRGKPGSGPRPVAWRAAA